VSEFALDEDERDAFAGHLDGLGVTELMRRESAPHSCRGGGAPQFGTGGSRRPLPPARGAVDDAQQRSDRELDAGAEPGLQLLPAPGVHADFATTPALAAPDQQ
jgi:hypothetical protein